MFCGHDEQSQNQGNFLECLNLLTQFDPFLQQHNAPSHATFLSLSSQNEMIACISEEVTESIIKEMRNSDFLGFSKLFGLDAQSITDATEQTLKSHTIDHLMCVAREGRTDPFQRTSSRGSVPSLRYT